MIEVQHLTKRYGTFTAVDDISFKVDKGEILGFLGPNGAGKTTTLITCSGLIPVMSGSITYGPWPSAGAGMLNACAVTCAGSPTMRSTPGPSPSFGTTCR